MYAHFKIIFFSTLMIFSVIAPNSQALANSIDKLTGLPANTEISIPELGVSGITNELGELVADFSCIEGETYNIIGKDGEHLTPFVCQPISTLGYSAIAAGTIGAVVGILANSGGGNGAGAAAPTADPFVRAHVGDNGCGFGTATVSSTTRDGTGAITAFTVTFPGNAPITYTGGPAPLPPAGAGVGVFGSPQTLTIAPAGRTRQALVGIQGGLEVFAVELTPDGIVFGCIESFGLPGFLVADLSMPLRSRLNA